MNNSFAIFSEDILENIETIKILGNQRKKLGDTILFTDNISSNKYSDYAIFSSFYMKFFSGIVIFLNIEDYTQYKDSIMGRSMLYLTEEILKSNNIDISIINKNDIFSSSGDCS